MERKKAKPEIGYSSIGKLKQILDCFTFNKTLLTVQQIAKRVDIPTSSLYRYLQSMVAAGFLTHNKSSNTYALGMSMIEMGGVALMQYEIRYAALPEMNTLGARTNMNVNLSILDGCDIFHLAYSIRYHAAPWVDAIGRRTTAYQTAMGLSILAFKPYDEVEELIYESNARDPVRYPLPDFDKLKIAFDSVRKTQFLTTRHTQPTVDSVCMASPVRRRGSEICAALSVNWFKDYNESPVENCIATVQPLVINTAARISYKLGYVGRSYGPPI